MNMENFKIHLTEILQNSLGEKAAVSIKTENFRGTPEEALNVRMLKEKKLFSIPVSSLYRAYRIEKDISAVASMALASILSAVTLEKNNIIYGLVNASEQKEFLKKVPHITFYDMAIIFNYVTFTNSGRSFLTITNDFMEEHKLTIRELEELAKKNTFRLFPCTASPTVFDAFRALMETPGATLNDYLNFASQAFCSRNELPTLTAACENYKNGSVALLNMEFLSEIADRFERNLLLLPASDQAFVIMPYSSKYSKDYIHTMTENVLKIGDSPILTRNVFIFNRNTRRLGLFV